MAIAIVCKAGNKAEISEIGTSLEELQELVGGLIEYVYSPMLEQISPRLRIIGNEEGKIDGVCKPCRPLLDSNGRIYDVMFGTFAIVYENEDGDIVDIPNDIIKKLLNNSWISQRGFLMHVGEMYSCIPERVKKNVLYWVREDDCRRRINV